MKEKIEKYVVHEKIIARTFTVVEASSEKEAISKVSMGEGTSMNKQVEFAGTLPTHTWEAELLNNEGSVGTPTPAFYKITEQSD